MKQVYVAIGALADYAISHGLAEEADRHYLVNALLEKLGLDDYEAVGDVPFAGLNDILKEEIGRVFVHVLEDAGVYKCTDEGRAAFRRFIATL